MKKIKNFLSRIFTSTQTDTSHTHVTEDVAAVHIPLQENISVTSVKASTQEIIDGTTLSINYYSPRVRGRFLWGGLVPLDEVWVTGAHSATTLSITSDFMIEGTTIPAGKYGLFTIPSKGEWTLVLNKNWQQHLTDDYDPGDDIIRVPLLKENNEIPIERLEYFIQNLGNKVARISMKWELVMISFDVQVIE
jgi:hypothetical protein